ncbi:MAG: NDP-sugar synthase [Myxococcota bacterium]
MRAMVLCAGLGTRLRPITNLWPKPAVPLLGAPLLRYALATLQAAGVSEVGINTHHLPEVMEGVARAECERAHLRLTVSHEAGEIQGTGGGIRGLADFLRGGDFAVLNGDVLFALELGPVLEAHRKSGAAATMVLLPMPEGERFNAVEVDASGAVRRIAGQGPGGERLTSWHFSGVHVMTPAVFDFMAASGPEDINRDVYPRMIAKGLTVRAHVLADRAAYWSDLGSPPRYAATHRHLLFGQAKMERFGAVSPFSAPRGEGNFWAHPTAQLADVRVAGPAWFGERCVLERGVRIGAAVSVGPGAHVGADTHLNRVAVLDGARVPAGRLIEDAIVFGDGQVVATGEVPSGA